MSEQKIAYYLNFSDVIRVLRLIDETPFQELRLEMEGLKVHIVQDKDTPLSPAPAAAKAALREAPRASQQLPSPGQAAAAARAADTRSNGTPVLAPLAGTFYRAPSPGEAPFVEVGMAVKEGDVVGILEIMKLMNHVTAPCSGVVAEICARNEDFVEFGDVLAIIEPERAG